MQRETRLKIVFMGTPAVAVPVLSAVLDAGYSVVGVYTQPDRPTGRGRRIASSEVKRFAVGRGLRVFQPTSLRRDESGRQELASLRPDVVVVAAYGLFLPSNMLNLPRLGGLNVHPSLLPLYRGPSPVASAILNGDSVTGVTVMQIDEGMDSGPILLQREAPIGPDETAGELTMRLFQIGAHLLVDVLPKWERGETRARPQNQSKATVSKRLTKEDGEIDWKRPAAHIARQVRAYHPWPGSFTHWRGRQLKVIEASVVESDVGLSGYPGQALSLPHGVGVVSGEGVLELGKLQLESKRPVSGQQFAQGYRDFVGSKVGPLLV